MARSQWQTMSYIRSLCGTGCSATPATDMHSDLGLDNSIKGIVWSTGGEIAVANSNALKVRVWHSA
jgi:hypothetical protein